LFLISFCFSNDFTPGKAFCLDTQGSLSYTPFSTKTPSYQLKIIKKRRATMGKRRRIGEVGMKVGKPRWPVLCVVLAFVFAAVLLVDPLGAAEQKGDQPKTLKIGALVCLTGWFSSYDIQTGKNEPQLVVDMINERGGINIKGQKYKIELVPEDCKSTLDGVTEAATSLASQGIKFTIGPAAFFGRASAPITNRNRILDALGYNVLTPDEIGPNVPYTFAGFGGAAAEFLAGLNFVKAKFPNIKKVCMVAPAGASNKYLVAFHRQQLAAKGYETVGDYVVYPDDTSDWSSFAAKINANKEADAVFWGNAITFHVSGMVKALREIGYDKWVFEFSGGASTDNVVKLIGKDLARKISTASFMPDSKNNPPELQALIHRSQAKYGPDIPLSMQTATSLAVLIDMIEKAQSIDSTVVKKTWESMDGQTIKTLYGPGIISGTKTYKIKGHGLGNPIPHEITNERGEVSEGGWFPSGPIP
jgi:branched-chain amino acid transport system substrate-binding protein